MKLVASLIFGLLNLAVPSFAVTIENGGNYEAKLNGEIFSEAIQSCCPIVSFDPSYRIRSLQFGFSGDVFDPGESFLFQALGKERVILLSTVVSNEGSGFGTTHFTVNFAEAQPESSPIAEQYLPFSKLRILFVNGDFNLLFLNLSVEFDGVIEGPSGPQSVKLKSSPDYNFVRDLKNLNQSTLPPTPVPLPASIFLLAAAVLSLRLAQANHPSKSGRV